MLKINHIYIIEVDMACLNLISSNCQYNPCWREVSKGRNPKYVIT